MIRNELTGNYQQPETKIIVVETNGIICQSGGTGAGGGNEGGEGSDPLD